MQNDVVFVVIMVLVAILLLVALIVPSIIQRTKKYKSNGDQEYLDILKVSNSDDDFGKMLDNTLNSENCNTYHIV